MVDAAVAPSSYSFEETGPCPNNMAPHQIPDPPPIQQLAIPAPVVQTTLSCGLQSCTSKQKRRSLLQLNMNLECPGSHTQSLDPASMARALWNYKRPPPGLGPMDGVFLSLPRRI